jgi:D-xylose transport system ATP-binding protein
MTAEENPIPEAEPTQPSANERGVVLAGEGVPARSADIDRGGQPLVEMRDIRVAFGGVHAVDGVNVDLYPGEVVGLVGGNGAGKSTLMKCLSGARPPDSGQILVNGQKAEIHNPRDAKKYNIETIYQTLALADNQDAPANLFLGRELKTRFGNLDDAAMEDATRKVVARLNPNFQNFKTPVKSLSGGQRQAVAIARAVHFNAKILIMDEPTAALGPAETAQVRELIKQLEKENIGIFLISHDIHDVFDLSHRIAVMYHGRIVGVVNKDDVTPDDVLGMIIMGKSLEEVTEEERATLH